MDNSEIIAVYGECLHEALGLSPARIFDELENDIAQIKKGALNPSRARSLNAYRSFTLEAQKLRMRCRVPEKALRESLLTRARTFANKHPLEETTYDQVREHDELKVLYKFLQWQRKENWA